MVELLEKASALISTDRAPVALRGSEFRGLGEPRLSGIRNHPVSRWSAQRPVERRGNLWMDWTRRRLQIPTYQHGYVGRRSGADTGSSVARGSAGGQHHHYPCFERS